MNDDPRIADFRRLLLRPASVDEVRATLPALDELVECTSGKVAEEVHDLRRRAFEILRELTADEPDRAVTILTDDLLPRCLRPDREDGSGHRLCYTFGEWLGTLPEEHRHQVRTKAIPLALAALVGLGVRSAIRLVSCIGYWNGEILGALDQLARVSSDETGDHALSALVCLRSELDPLRLEFYLGMLHARIPVGPNLHQLICARVIGTPETAELVWSHWLANPTNGTDSKGFYAALARSLLTEIAARVRIPVVTERVWNWLVELSRRPSDGLDHVFSANSSLVNRLDVTAAVPELIRLATRAVNHHRYLYYLRVLECERPAHMGGWDSVPTHELEQVRVDAVAPTGMTGRMSTIELHHKESAWDVLLCRGDRSALPPFGDALAAEGGYVVHRFLELGACLRLDPLPATVKALLAASGEWKENERWVAQIGAIEAARGAGTREAFDALLGYHQIGEGVLLSAVEALAETVLLGLEDWGSDRSPVEQLLVTAESAEREDSRGLSAAAIAALLEEGVLTQSESERGAALLDRPTTDAYAKRELLYAFSSLPPELLPPAAVGFAERVLASPEHGGNHDPHPAALALLARRPGADADRDFLVRHLDIADDAGAVRTGPRTLRGVVPHVVGRYYRTQPARFASAVAACIREGDAGAVAHVLPAVREVGSQNQPDVLTALVARLRRADTGRQADPAVLRALASIAPDRLLTDGCEHVTAWLPQARAELADVLGELGPVSAKLVDARFALLTRLAGDGVYAVRRSAYRAAVGCDADRFADLATSWARWQEEGRQGPRRYAAECAGWLPEQSGNQLVALSWDPEPAVREAYQRSLREREERAAAGTFEQHVLGVSDPEAVVRNWRYGVALARVGDDSTLSRLARRLEDELPPAVRFWLKRVQKSVERRWAEVTRKWPEPWYSRPGRIESVTGTLRGEDGKAVHLSATLWLMSGEVPGQLSSWGGWGTCGARCQLGSAKLIIPNRPIADIVVGNAAFPSQAIQFWGNSAYPESTA